MSGRANLLRRGSVAKHRIALIGYGQIARTQHAPNIAASPHFDLVAAVTLAQDHGLNIPVFSDIAQLLATPSLGLDAAAICTPPAVRHSIALSCLEAGLHILLEKPTASTLGEATDIAVRSHAVDRTAFATWHAREHIAVEHAVRRVQKEGLASMAINWHENWEKWHPGQDWIWQPGGFGVFDPGINALSIASHLVGTPLLVRGAALTMEPHGQQPVAATLDLEAAGVTGPMVAEFDWRPTTKERWDLRLMTQSGTQIWLAQGGRSLRVDGRVRKLEDMGAYPRLYARFADLIATRRSDMDVEPLRLVADAFLVASRH